MNAALNRIGLDKHAGKVEPCSSGFHLCENPLDVLNYYSPAGKLAEVEGSGKIARHADDSKVACSEIHIKAEIGLSALIGACVKFVFDKIDWSKAEKTNKKEADDSGNHSVLNGRLHQKIKQTMNGASNLPAIASVVGFKEKAVLIRRVDNK